MSDPVPAMANWTVPYHYKDPQIAAGPTLVAMTQYDTLYWYTKSTGALTATVPLAAAGAASSFALAAAPEGENGDYKATTLTAASTWQVSQQNGAFAYTGHLNRNGDTDEYTFDYPGDESVYTIGLQVYPDVGAFLNRAGFTVYNPNAASTCGCGHSFQTADHAGQAQQCH